MTNSVNVTVRDHASGITSENLPLRSLGELQMCLPPQQKLAREEAIVDCVTFFTRRGKAAKL